LTTGPSLEAGFFFNNSQALPHLFKFDGIWEGASNLVQVRMEIQNGHVKGKIEKCFMPNHGRWTRDGPPFSGEIDGSGRLTALTDDPYGDWAQRRISGTLPALQMNGTGSYKSLDCPDATVTVRQQD
jgi:hypothetical protein